MSANASPPAPANGKIDNASGPGSTQPNGPPQGAAPQNGPKPQSEAQAPKDDSKSAAVASGPNSSSPPSSVAAPASAPKSPDEEKGKQQQAAPKQSESEALVWHNIGTKTLYQYLAVGQCAITKATRGAVIVAGLRKLSKEREIQQTVVAHHTMVSLDKEDCKNPRWWRVLQCELSDAGDSKRRKCWLWVWDQDGGEVLRLSWQDVKQRTDATQALNPDMQRHVSSKLEAAVKARASKDTAGSANEAEDMEASEDEADEAGDDEKTEKLPAKRPTRKRQRSPGATRSRGGQENPPRKKTKHDRGNGRKDKGGSKDKAGNTGSDGHGGSRDKKNDSAAPTGGAGAMPTAATNQTVLYPQVSSLGSAVQQQQQGFQLYNPMMQQTVYSGMGQLMMPGISAPQVTALQPTPQPMFMPQSPPPMTPMPPGPTGYVTLPAQQLQAMQQGLLAFQQQAQQAHSAQMTAMMMQQQHNSLMQQGNQLLNQFTTMWMQPLPQQLKQ